jgi:acetyltransferase-like isoleucine patch superfamily enzyme
MIIYFLKLMFQPFKRHFALLFLKCKLKKQYPNLKLSGFVLISNSKFGRYNYIENAKISNSTMDDFSYVGTDSEVNFCEIGKFTCIGPNVKIGLGSHPTSEFISVHPVFYSMAAQVGTTFSDDNYFQEYEKTVIGNDVWIGANVIIKSGIVIGDGAIIASGSVVTKDVMSYSVMGGVPSKLIKMRFQKDEIEKLLDIKWWNYDEYWIRKHFSFFHSIKNLNKF